MLGGGGQVAFQAASQVPKQGLTFDHTDRLHLNQEREGLKVTGPEGGCCYSMLPAKEVALSL